MEGELLSLDLNDIQGRIDANYVSRIEKSIESIDLLFQDIAIYSEMNISEQLLDWFLIKSIAKAEVERFKNEKLKA